MDLTSRQPEFRPSRGARTWFLQYSGFCTDYSNAIEISICHAWDGLLWMPPSSSVCWFMGRWEERARLRPQEHLQAKGNTRYSAVAARYPDYLLQNLYDVAACRRFDTFTQRFQYEGGAIVAFTRNTPTLESFAIQLILEPILIFVCRGHNMAKGATNDRGHEQTDAQAQTERPTF